MNKNEDDDDDDSGSGRIPIVIVIHMLGFFFSWVLVLNNVRRLGSVLSCCETNKKEKGRKKEEWKGVGRRNTIRVFLVVLLS